MTNAIATTNPEVQALATLGLSTIREKLAATAPPPPQVSGVQFLKVHQHNTAFPGAITYGAEAVPVEETAQFVIDYKYEVGMLWRDGMNVVKQAYFSWLDDGVEERLAAMGPGGKDAWRARAVGVTAPHVGVQIEMGGDTNGWKKFFGQYIPQLDHQCGIDVTRVYAVISFSLDSYTSKYGNEVYDPIPLFHRWVSEAEAHALVNESDEVEVKVVIEPVEPTATARPRRRSMV